MALTFFQKIKLAIRGWSRRSEESSARKKEEFLAREGSWGQRPAPPASPPPTAAPRAPAHDAIDREGLQVAFLDDSGQFEHYLDVESGDVLDVRIGQGSALDQRSGKFRRIPRRSLESEAADRAVFLDSLEEEADRRALAESVPDARAFRKKLGENRLLEKRWYNFKNDRASEAIEEWLEVEKLVARS